jgi:UDP-N-acetylglucosamine:LPS N-acetylglucosamine transferase
MAQMKKCFLITVNMGYGHQRTAFPLKFLSQDEIIVANNYPGIPKKDKEIWEKARKFYETVSRLETNFPFFGKLIFKIFDQFQKIRPFYPKKPLSSPNFSTRMNYLLFKKLNWGKDLIEKLKVQSLKLKNNLPIVSTFFTPAFMAEYFQYPGEIFCVVCDADISRSWAPLNPQKSKIKYFAPTERVVERLKLYGVKPENIFLTGYPLPKENLETLKEDLKFRILNLDPGKNFLKKYQDLVSLKLGNLPEKPDHPLTILFSVGGAGAQKEIGFLILKSLKEEILKENLKIILSAGIRKETRDYFLRKIKSLKLEEKIGKNVEILYEEKIENYFQKFNLLLKKTDILWTKPSELSFYSALGIPIICAPPLGSQEEFNLRWLIKSGFGILQENPKYTREWLFDWIKRGYLAEMAMEAFVEGEKFGTLNIERIITSL